MADEDHQRDAKSKTTKTKAKSTKASESKKAETKEEEKPEPVTDDLTVLSQRFNPKDS